MVRQFTLSNFNTSRSYLALTKSLASGAAVTCVLAVVGLVASPAKAAVLTNSAQLSDLIGTGNQFQVDDKLFSNFLYTASGGAQPPAADVVVAGQNLPGDPAIFFTGAFQGQSPFGDITIAFNVTDLNPATSITGAALSVSGVESPSAFTDTETVFTNNIFGTQLGKLTATPASPTDSISFAPQKVVGVTEDIRALSPGFVFSVDAKSFQQAAAVPEPSSVLGTLAFGTFATGLLLKRKQKKQKPATATLTKS